MMFWENDVARPLGDVAYLRCSSHGPMMINRFDCFVLISPNQLVFRLKAKQVIVAIK